MSRLSFDSVAFNGIGNADQHSSLPPQAIPSNQKDKKWIKAVANTLENIGLSQVRKNLRFVDYRNMKDGKFSYKAVSLEDMQIDWFEKEMRKLGDVDIPSHIRHFDFIGIIVNVITSLYAEYQDRFEIDSRDEYFTNEYIRAKTEKMHEYAASVFQQELNRILVTKGIDPNKKDFESQEEQQSYQQQLQEQVKALTPSEIEEFMSKNFKTVAVEWAKNVVENDKQRFDLEQMEIEMFVDYLLTGRFFKHYHIGYDSYTPERWKPEETFFSEDYDILYPQNAEYVGRILEMSPDAVLSKYAHIMSSSEQEAVGNYWNKSKKEYIDRAGGINTNYTNSYRDVVFPNNYIVPHENYFDHQVNVQMENALGVPLGRTTFMDANGQQREVPTWMPRYENETFSPKFSRHLRGDIDVRKDTIRVMEAYWRSRKRMAVLVTENEVGGLAVDLVTDLILEDFLKENEISKLRETSIEEIRRALNENRLDEYKNTITYFYTPEIWKVIKIKANGTTLKEDLYLDARPLDHQIKGGNSNLFDVLIPVSGIITQAPMTKAIPFQQLYNISMNQITEYLEKELGTFYTFDFNALSDELKDETLEEAVYNVREIVKDTGILPLDLSRGNTQGNNPNVFQRQEITHASQVQYRYQLAQQYKQEALAQFGITPQIMGTPTAVETAEGVKQGVQASYGTINLMLSKVSSAKAKDLELGISVAQFCQVNGKDYTTLFRSSDQELRFLDILAQDGEIFPLRSLNVYPSNSAKDRKILETVKLWALQNNTFDRTLEDSISLLTDPTITEIKDIAKRAQKRTELQRQQEFQQQQQLQQQQIDAMNKLKEQQKETEFEVIDRKGAWAVKEAEIRSGNADSTNYEQFRHNLDFMQKDFQNSVNNEFRQQELDIKKTEAQRKSENDKSQINTKLLQLKQKAEELALRRQEMQSKERVALFNKN